jgi:pimeloyl-ACP methyl ester carboxylesterase
VTQLRYERAALPGIGLGYEITGTGDPVVLIHAGVCADFFRPLMAQPALAGRFRLVRYHRAGYGASDRLAGPVSAAQQAEHCRALLRSLGIRRAHLVGHSSGGTIALQIALDEPDLVQSLALLEATLLTAVASGAFVGEALERYHAGDRAGAIDTFMRGVGGPDYRAELDRAIPGAFEQAVLDADTFFGQELTWLRGWQFTAADAARIAAPALVVLGERSHLLGPAFQSRYELLLAWLPNAEPFVLPAANHLLQVQNPAGMAAALAAFAERHPLPPQQ